MTAGLGSGVLGLAGIALGFDNTGEGVDTAGLALAIGFAETTDFAATVGLTAAVGFAAAVGLAATVGLALDLTIALPGRLDRLAAKAGLAEVTNFFVTNLFVIGFFAATAGFDFFILIDFAGAGLAFAGLGFFLRSRAFTKSSLRIV